MDAFRVFMAFAAEITPDQQGRVVIPQALRDYAGLGSEIVTNGRLDRAEIWDKRKWSAVAPAGDEDLARSVAELGL